MRIVQICAEFAPIAKAGGMGEVLLGLTQELRSQGYDVEVLIPKYDFLDLNELKHLSVDLADVRCQENGQTVSNVVWSALYDDCPLFLLDALHPSGYFHREKIYGYEDDTARFLYFCKAILEYLVAKGKPIDILHLHDWHAAACAIFLRDFFAQKLKVRSVLLTVHNFEYQGRCATWDLDALGLDGKSYCIPAKLQDPDPRYSKVLNLLKGGILYADAVNTVSPSYATESIAPKGGYGLSSILKKRKFLGILNGIDTKRWNPKTDPYLEAHYWGDQPSPTIQMQKKANKKALQQLGLESLDHPLFGVVSRLMPNKGSALLQQCIAKILAEGGSFVLIGSSPDPAVQKQFDQLKEDYKNHPNVMLCYQYEDLLAHRIYAACDFLLVPSLIEPCGLTQLIALRYGAIPVVRCTGGLKDTVFDCEDSSIPSEKRNGLLFHEPTKEALEAAISRAVGLWTTQSPLLQLAQKRAMQADYGWKKGVKEYIKLYQSLLV